MHPVNDLNNFIAGWYIEPALCDDLIDQYRYLAENGYEKDIEADWQGYRKVLFGELAYNLQQEYRKCLSKVADEYKEKYKYSHEGQHHWSGLLDPNFQRYQPGDYYSKYHCENCGSPADFTRHLAYMTFCNDIEEGGETEFYYQNIKIKPEKGLTLIWPAHWTHIHRGIPAPREEKFIITGWYTYDIYKWRA